MGRLAMTGEPTLDAIGFGPSAPKSPRVRRDSTLSVAMRRRPPLTSAVSGLRPETLAERVGFEPTVAFQLQRLSRPADSTTLAPLRGTSWLGTADHTVPGLPAKRQGHVESKAPRDRSCVNPGLRATMRAFNPARPGREQRLGEVLGDAVGSGFTHGRPTDRLRQRAKIQRHR